MKAIKKLSLFAFCVLSMGTMPVLRAETTPATPVATVLTDDEQAMQDFINSFKRMIPTLPATIVQSFIAGNAFSAGKDCFQGIKNVCKNASIYVGSQAMNLSANAIDYAKNGTMLAQISDLIGSYSNPESAESLYDAMQTVQATCNGEGVVSAQAVENAMQTIRNAVCMVPTIMPTNAEWLQQHMDIATGTKVAAVVAVTAVTYLAAKKLVKKYKTS